MAEGTEQKNPPDERPPDLAERAVAMSDEVLKSIESGQRNAIEAVRKFVGAVEESLPGHGDDHPSRRETIVNAALNLADDLVKTQYEFIRSVVGNASETLRKQNDDKPSAE
jgi:hypothetical protein